MFLSTPPTPTSPDPMIDNDKYHTRNTHDVISAHLSHTPGHIYLFQQLYVRRLSRPHLHHSPGHSHSGR